MKTKIERNKIVYQFDIQKADAYGLFKFGKYRKFQTPDSDGDKVEKVIRSIKDRKKVTITITVNKPIVEYLGWDDIWRKSLGTVEGVSKFTKGSSTTKYQYYAKGGLTYRIKRE